MMMHHFFWSEETFDPVRQVLSWRRAEFSSLIFISVSILALVRFQRSRLALAACVHVRAAGNLKQAWKTGRKLWRRTSSERRRPQVPWRPRRKPATSDLVCRSVKIRGILPKLTWAHLWAPVRLQLLSQVSLLRQALGCSFNSVQKNVCLRKVCVHGYSFI